MFGVAGENHGHGCAAPLATAVHVVRDLAGDALVFVTAALVGGFRAGEFAEIEH
jgi:hypothetical protein